ncbi:hypothetical protein N7449_009554, partial [Penicillium cf. viridicatum]
MANSISETNRIHIQTCLQNTQVRCDRLDPCGNCQDAGISCCRRRDTKRRSKSTRRQKYQNSHSPHSPRLQTIPDYQFDAKLADISNDTSAEVMPECSVPSHDPDDFYKPGARISYDLAYDAQITVGNQSNEPGGVLSRIPSTELLTWMLKDIQSDRFGSFIADYFRHISKPTLKRMGLSLLHNKASPYESKIYTVCVNDTAYRFLTTVINLEDNSELVLGLRKSTTEYRAAAQAALKQIPLLTTPSLGLLQAIICGAFLYQTCGDVCLSGDLIKSACKICIDLDLHNMALHGNATEEEFFCFIRCYTLNRHYAFQSRKLWYPLDVQLPSNLCDLYPTYPPISELLLIHLDLAHVQDTMISCLPRRSLTDEDVLSLYYTGNSMLRKMQYIGGRMSQIFSFSSQWKGLDTQAEISTLKFAYHIYVLSAEKQPAVNLLNRTVLLYPATAYFVVFCNFVATSDIGDFNLMKAIVDRLAQSGISYSLVQLRTLFQTLLSLSQGVFNDERIAMQRIPLEPQSYSSVSYPVGNQFSVHWNADEYVFNQFLFTGAENYSEML